MTDEQQNNIPVKDEAENAPDSANGADAPPAPAMDNSVRLERVGGEPAPVITPEEFARLQSAGQVHIDSRGRVTAARRPDAEAGVSLRKRRAWYTQSSLPPV
jgi:hypothetical protein